MVRARGAWGRAFALGAALGTAAVATLSGCREETPPPELPPRAIQWEQVSGSAAETSRVVTALSSHQYGPRV